MKSVRTRHISQHSVGDVFRIARGKNIFFEDIRNKSKEEVYQVFLHLCSMAIYISLFNVYRPGKIKHEILYSLCMPGAAAALLFPAWSAYPMMSLINIQNFLQHFLLMIYPIMLVVSKKARPDYKNLPKCMLFLFVIAPPIFIFNKIFDTNFLFINNPIPNSPLSLFASWFGSPGYIFGLFLLIILVWIFLYTPFVIKDIKKANEAL